MDNDITCDDDQETVMLKLLKSMVAALQRPEEHTCIEYFADRFNQFFSLTGDVINLVATINLLLLNHIQPVEQVTPLTQLILILFEKLCGDYHLYEYYFLMIVKYCHLSLKIHKISDVTTYEDEIRGFYNACVYILGSTQNVVITQKLLQLLVIKATTSTHCRFKNRLLVNCFITSKCPEILSELLLIAEFHLYFEYLRAVEQLLTTDLECQEFVKYNAVDIITKRLLCDRMKHGQYTNEDLQNHPIPIHFDLSHRVLWLLFRGYLNGSEAFKKSVILTISPDAWMLFRNIWEIDFSVAPSLGLSLDIFSLGFTSEVPCKDPSSWVSNVQFFPDRLDFELKIEVFSMLRTAREVRLTAEIIRHTYAVPSILIILDITEKVIWTPAQREKLMYYGLLGLHGILHIMIEDFIIYKGPERLLLIIEQILNNTLPLYLLLNTLSCMNKSLSIPDYDRCKIIKKYKDNNAVNLLTELLLYSLKSSHLSKPTQNTISVSFCILGKLTDTCSKEVINASLNILEKYVRLQISSGFLLPELLLAIMTYLWECLMSSCCDLEYFIASGGIYTILDIIEQFPLAIKLVGLSMLCDFCENEGTLACLLTWRGKDQSTVVRFLLKVYRKQSIFDQQLNERKGALKDTNTADSNGVLLELLGNCKPKISALLHILSCSPQVNIINRSYLISPTDVDDIDKVTAKEAEHYFNLTYGEAWIDVEDYFRIIGYDPLVFDKALLGYQVKKHENLLKHLVAQQVKYQVQNKMKETKIEYNLYNGLKKQLLSESLDALQELKKIAMLSNTRLKAQEYNRMFEKLLRERTLNSFNVQNTFPTANRLNIFQSKVEVYSNIVADPKPEDLLQVILSTTSSIEDIFEALSCSADFSLPDSCQ